MNLDLTHVDVWAAEIDDKPGALSRTLRAIADYGADLECVIARREPTRPGKGVVFVSPLKARPAIENADQIGLRRTTDLATLRIEGPNEAGIGATLVKTMADTGVNLHGLSAMTLGHRFVCYVGFDNVEDRVKAEEALKKLSGHDWKFWRHTETTAKETAAAHR